MLSSHMFDAYGLELSSPASTEPWGFGAQWGGYTDRETGLVLMTHRYYDPHLARFLTRDPSGYAASLNLYAYGGNNPVCYADPNGHFLFLITGAVGAGIGAVIGGGVAWWNGENVWVGIGKGALLGGIAGLTGGIAGEAVAGWIGGTAIANGVISGIAGGVVGDAAQQGVALLLHWRCEFSVPELLASGAVGGVLGGLGGWWVTRSGCFVAGTPVRMADGTYRPVERIRRGDHVAARDAATGRLTVGRVKRTFVRTVDHTLVLTLASGEQIETTENHPFFVARHGFMAAGRLALGTQIVTRAGPAAVLTRVERRAGPTKVYNFEVEGAHSYFVGAAGGGLWVHNAPCWWESPGGLRYETGSAQGNRVAHVFEHLIANPGKVSHSVFNVRSSQELIDLLDEAWANRGLPDPADPAAYVVNLRRAVGTAGQEWVRLVVKPGTNVFVTAYPVWGP